MTATCALNGPPASAGAGRFADEIAITAALTRPPAIVQGAEEQLVSLEYLQKLEIPSLWRGAVQVVPGAGHAPHHETPGRFAALLTGFLDDLGDRH